MFIRRKQRRLRKAFRDGNGKEREDWRAFDFVLVSTVRTPAGPRQRIVGYIGSVEERLVHHDHIRYVFYRDAIPRLKSLAQPRQYKTLLKSLQLKVPPPPKGYKPPRV